MRCGAVRRGGGSGSGGDDGGKRRSHVPVIHFDTTRLAVERRTLRGAVVTFAHLRCPTPVATVHTYIHTRFDVKPVSTSCTRLPTKVSVRDGAREGEIIRVEERESVRQETQVLFRPQCQDGLRTEAARCPGRIFPDDRSTVDPGNPPLPVDPPRERRHSTTCEALTTREKLRGKVS